MAVKRDAVELPPGWRNRAFLAKQSHWPGKHRKMTCAEAAGRLACACVRIITRLMTCSIQQCPCRCRKFVGELARVCAPDGRIIIVTWCHRVLAPGEAELRPEEQSLLDRICEAYYLPAWCSVADYEQLFKDNGIVVSQHTSCFRTTKRGNISILQYGRSSCWPSA